LRILHYGAHHAADVRLLDYDTKTMRLNLAVSGQYHSANLGAPGLHVAYNALACVTVAVALGLPIDILLGQLSLFRSLPGRGQVLDVMSDGRRIKIIDESYNANPLSVRAA